MDKNAIGHFIAELRKQKGFTQKELCTCQVKVDTKKSISTGSPVRSCTELGFYSPRQLLDAGC